MNTTPPVTLTLPDAPSDVWQPVSSELSAVRTLTQAQAIVFIAIAVFIAGAIGLWGLERIARLANEIALAFYGLLLVHRTVTLCMGLRMSRRRSGPQKAWIEDPDLPFISVMVPMYREAAVLGQMIDGLTQMEYPPARMEVLLLLEEDDVETREACQALELPAGFRVVVVPPGRPRTKPRACNYGLALCRGDVVVIYDAEDQPERDQFLIAAQALRDEPPNVACVQARLAYYNPRQNLLTRWFATEYLTWFGIMLPGMHGMGAPIPLGGTSNFFRTEALRSVGGWDSWNVAEDCDLGMRLYRFGYRVQIIDSTTWEEACPEVGLWIRQRSRWAKGYMQTWLVHNRRPGQLWHDMGPWRFINMQIVIGASVLCLLLNPIYWGLTALWWIHPTHLEQSIVGFGPILIVGNLCFWVGNSIFILFHCLGAVRTRAWDLALFGLFAPLYWVLMSIAAWKALWQILVAPHFWEKTRHGLAKKRGSQAS